MNSYLDGGVLFVVRDGDDAARALYLRHYSSRKARWCSGRLRRRYLPNQQYFVGPGEKLVLRSADGLVVFAWRWSVFRHDGQEGVECTLFRNESRRCSSDLIREAVSLVRVRWPGQRLFTYCKATRDRKGCLIQYGRCFLEAGWNLVAVRGMTFIWELAGDQ
jgi:hypothetical protein